MAIELDSVDIARKWITKHGAAVGFRMSNAIAAAGNHFKSSVTVRFLPASYLADVSIRTVDATSTERDSSSGLIRSSHRLLAWTLLYQYPGGLQ